MGLGLLLIPTLGGYWLLTRLYYTRYGVLRDSGYHVLFKSAIAGCSLFVVSRLAVIFFLNPLFPYIGKIWKYCVPFDYSGTVTLSYLWEAVWQRDSWLDIIHRFIHLYAEKSTGKTPKETLIFPRYHQLTAVRALIAATKAKGPGHNYLIQHSAGAGKTNTISYLAHQLASVHDDDDRPIFNSVVVVSDRRNLDKQLQDTIYQVEHKQGVVAKIDDDRNSSDLADELNKGTKIIITTLQKFSFLMDKVQDLSARKFAVIVDEAHSSQGGHAAGYLRNVLGSTPSTKTKTRPTRHQRARTTRPVCHSRLSNTDRRRKIPDRI